MVCVAVGTGLMVYAIKLVQLIKFDLNTVKCKYLKWSWIK